LTRLVGLLCLLISLKAAAQEPFFHKDWALSCDNTHTCYAEGYQEESALSPISMLITRPAGPKTAVSIKLQLQASYELGNEQDPGLDWTFKLGGETLKTTVKRDSLTWNLTPQQVQKVLPKLLNHSFATVYDGRHEWVLSLQGAKAVLLKMDEFQGRIDTPSAIVKRGHQPESKVLKPLPMPIIKAVLPLKSSALTKDNEIQLKEAIVAQIDKEDYSTRCNEVNSAPTAKDFSIHPLSKDRLLLGYACPVGAYNFSGLFWMVNTQEPYSPHLLEITGDYFDPEDGTITEVMKGRGVGDCIYKQSWVYDGQRFVVASTISDTMCRGFAGGAWSIPKFVSRVVYATESK
jgi:Protein of unknown function (DUF1176)